MVALKCFLARLGQDPDHVDDRIDRRDQALERARIVDVGVDDIDRGQQDEVFGALAAAGRDAVVTS